MLMIRGTTPTHIFQIPFDTGLLKEIRVSYAQGNKVIAEKKTEDCILDGDTISVTLTQEDTLKFKHMKIVEIQLKVLTEDGCVMATPIIRKDVSEVLNEEVLV